MMVTITYVKTKHGPQQVCALTLFVDTEDHIDALNRCMLFAAGITTIPIVSISMVHS